MLDDAHDQVFNYFLTSGMLALKSSSKMAGSRLEMAESSLLLPESSSYTPNQSNLPLVRAANIALIFPSRSNFPSPQSIMPQLKSSRLCTNRVPCNQIDFQTTKSLHESSSSEFASSFFPVKALQIGRLRKGKQEKERRKQANQIKRYRFPYLGMAR
jgi:hypothetical protein